MTTDRPPTTNDTTANLFAELQRLVPAALREGRLDADALRLALGQTPESVGERFGLSWPGKIQSLISALAPTTATLRPDPAASVEFERTRNVLIEGDNLEVLKLLQRGYRQRVKVIYIDPPYNTGKDFVYADTFKEGLADYLRLTGQTDGEGVKLTANTESRGRFHSHWLSMMRPRLHLARPLLTEDGVIIVSIDDHEVHHLRLLMDEVFGEENFIAQLFWDKSRKNDAKLFSAGHDYLIVYAASKRTLQERGTVWREPKPGASELWSKYCELRREHGEGASADRVIEQNLRTWFQDLPSNHPSKKLSRYKQVDRFGPWRDRDISWPGGGGPRYSVPHPVTHQDCKVPERGWGISKYEEMKRLIELGIVEFRADHTDPPFMKAHLKPIPEELLDESAEEEDEEDPNDIGMQVMTTGINRQAQVSIKYLRTLLGGKYFDNPKDHEVLARIIRYCSSDDPECLVLDFFGGSGSTAEAILALNRKDSGKRRFILVQLPEATKEDSPAYGAGFKSISDITRRRIFLAAERLTAGRRADEDLGFRYYRLTSSSFKPWPTDMHDASALARQLELYANPSVDGRNELDLLIEILLKRTRGSTLDEPLSAAWTTRSIGGQPVWILADGRLVICLSRQITTTVADALLALTPKSLGCLDDAFADDAAKANLAAQAADAGITFWTV